MSLIGKELYKSLVKRYQSEIQINKTFMLIYFNDSVKIKEHPQHLEEMDEMLGKITEANDKLESLMREFPSEEYK
mgnify:CR=1 FL=1|tara:strand:+ start:498 stop:722 length:225 start_codon:yes stop_codon:yes gene_type:complete